MEIFVFEIDNGNTGVRTVIEPLLRTEELAEQRAKREFMSDGYSHKFVQFDTWRTDLKLNDIISTKGQKFKITRIFISSGSSRVVTTIRGERYE